MHKMFTALFAVSLLWLIAGIESVETFTSAAISEKEHPDSSANNSSTKNSTTLSRHHVTVFFDHRVRYHTHEAENAYTKEDLSAMVNVVSRRFSKLLIDTAPRLPTLPSDDSAPSRVWIPSVVAKHNMKYPADPPMEVIVSFEFDTDIFSEEGQEGHQETSFDVARHMADIANNIFPGTVKTLMMTMYRNEKLEYAEESHDYTYWQYVQDWHNEDQFEIVYIDHLYHSAWPYKLGIFLDVHDCGRFRGNLPHKVKELLQYMSTVALFIDPTTFHHLTTLSAQETHKMFVAKFEDCERKLKQEKADVVVVPSTLWKSHHLTIASMVEDWQVKNSWAVENNKEIIMYEAFDTPGGRDFYYWGHGWWRLKDRSALAINESSFAEKIEDANSRIYTKDLYSSFEDSSSSEEFFFETYKNDPSSSHKPNSTSISNNATNNCTQNSSNSSSPSSLPNSSQAAPVKYPSTTVIHSTSTNHAIYIVLVLLAVICVILVISQVYFHSRLISNGPHGKFHRSFRSKVAQHHRFSNPGMEIDNVSTTGMVNPGFGPHTSNSNGAAKLNSGAAADDDGVASINGSVMEMSDTTPIVSSVSYKKM